MNVLNITRNTSLADRVCQAQTFFSRLIGLMNRGSLSRGEALIIPHCQAIHMCFMRFSIDVVFVDKRNRVVGIVEDIKPFRFSPVFFDAKYALELPAGTIAQSKTARGDEIVIL